MNNSEVNPAPVLESAHANKWERERRAFFRMLPDLLQTHRGKFVAIHEEKLVAEGDGFIPVARQAYQRFGYIPIYVSLVSVEPRTARVPSPRIVTQP